MSTNQDFSGHKLGLFQANQEIQSSCLKRKLIFCPILPHSQSHFPKAATLNFLALLGFIFIFPSDVFKLFMIFQYSLCFPYSPLSFLFPLPIFIPQHICRKSIDQLYNYNCKYCVHPKTVPSFLYNSSFLNLEN